MKNFFKNSTLKKLFVLLLLLFVFVCISAFDYVIAVSNNISNSVFRLHVIANSDNEKDQKLKYIVRDELLEYMNTIAKNSTSKAEVIEIANTHKDDFYNIAKKVITENGYDYDVNISIGNFNFPTKDYGDISLPAGYYDALRVEIGEGIGQNWWCVMFPPLCFVDVSSGVVPDESKKLMQDNLSNEEYSIISDNTCSNITFKFKLIEFFQSLKVANK